MGLRVKENGKSEGHPVMGWIGVASADNIILRESEQTSVWSFLTRKLGKQIQEAKQMTANTFAGAASHTEVNWRTINWSTVHQNVRRLQARIVKATQEGKWGKVKALQHLLTHSFSGKALAVRRVTGKPRQEHSWGRQGNLGYSRQEGRGHTNAEAERLPSSTAPARVYSKK